VLRVLTRACGYLKDYGGLCLLCRLCDRLNYLHVVDIEGADSVTAGIRLLEHFFSSYKCHFTAFPLREKILARSFYNYYRYILSQFSVKINRKRKFLSHFYRFASEADKKGVSAEDAAETPEIFRWIEPHTLSYSSATLVRAWKRLCRGGCDRRLKGGGKRRFRCASETEAYGDSVVDLRHDRSVKVPHFFLEPALVKSPYLLKQNDRVLGEPHAVGVNVNVRRQSRFAHTGGYGGGDDGRAVAVAYVVLNYKYRTQASLFTSHNGTQIGVKYISSSDRRYHFSGIPFAFLPLRQFLFLLQSYSCRKSRAFKQKKENSLRFFGARLRSCYHCMLAGVIMI
jgi:hypothetical protein